LFPNNIVLDKPLVSLRILLLFGGMNCLAFVYNLIHGIGEKVLCVRDLCHLLINVTYAKNCNI
jgi:hypothetical protein